jgi:hypothetical protein
MKFSYTGNKLHPTQIPVAALARLIRGFTLPGELVSDAFLAERMPLSGHPLTTVSGPHQWDVTV